MPLAPTINLAPLGSVKKTSPYPTYVHPRSPFPPASRLPPPPTDRAKPSAAGQPQQPPQQQYVPVVLQYTKHCAFGHGYAVVGSVPELGSWDPNRAVRMQVGGAGRVRVSVCPCVRVSVYPYRMRVSVPYVCDKTPLQSHHHHHWTYLS